jgi:hypothetical protein
MMYQMKSYRQKKKKKNFIALEPNVCINCSVFQTLLEKRLDIEYMINTLSLKDFKAYLYCVLRILSSCS